MKIIPIIAAMFAITAGTASAMCLHIRDNSQLYCYVKAPINPRER